MDMQSYLYVSIYRISTLHTLPVQKHFLGHFKSRDVHFRSNASLDTHAPRNLH